MCGVKETMCAAWVIERRLRQQVAEHRTVRQRAGERPRDGHGRDPGPQPAQFLPQRRRPFPPPAGREPQEDLLARLEVAQHRRLVQAHRLGDVGERDLPDPAFGAQPRRGRQDGLFTLLLGPGGPRALKLGRPRALNLGRPRALGRGDRARWNSGITTRPMLAQQSCVNNETMFY